MLYREMESRRWETMLHFGPRSSLSLLYILFIMSAISGCRLHRDSPASRPVFLFIGTSFVQVIKDLPSVNDRIKCRRAVEFILCVITFLEDRLKKKKTPICSIIETNFYLQKTRNYDLC